jgi:cell division protein FtsA
MNRAFVIDLGGSQVTGLVATSEDRLRVEAIASLPSEGVWRGNVTSPDAASAVLRHVMADLQAKGSGTLGPAVVAISGAHLEVLNGQGMKLIVPRARHITNQDVMEVVNHSRAILLPPDREQIHVVPRAFRIDGEPGFMRPTGHPGSKIEAETFIVTGKKDAVETLQRVVVSAGGTVDQIIHAGLAAGLGVLKSQEIDQGALVVDIGYGTTDIGLFFAGSIAFAASIPVGGGHVTSDIAELLKTSVEDAEQLKVVSGSASPRSVPESETVQVCQLGQPLTRPMHRRVLAEIIESRLREILLLAKAAIDKTGLNTRVTLVVLTGNGARIPNTDRLAAEVWPDHRIRVDFPTKGTAVALGLARYALQSQEEMAPAAPSAETLVGRVRSLFSGFGK